MALRKKSRHKSLPYTEQKNQNQPATNLYILDTNVFIHGGKNNVQRFVNLLAGLEPQQVVEIIENLRQQLVAILVHRGRHQDLLLRCFARNLQPV